MTETPMFFSPGPRAAKRAELLERVKELCEHCAHNEILEKVDGAYVHPKHGACKAAELHAELDAL